MVGARNEDQHVAPMRTRLPFSALAHLALPAALAALAPGSAGAAERTIKSLGSKVDAVSLAPLLARGELALLQAPSGGVEQVVVFGILDGPPERVFDVLMDVEHYPEFLKTVAETKVVRRGKEMLVYTWKLDVPLLSFAGTRMQRGRSPSLVEVRSPDGNFRGSAERWELLPIDGGKRTVAAFYRTLDVSTGGLVIEALAKLEPSFGQALAVATTYVHLKGMQDRVANRKPPTPAPRTGPVPPLQRLALADGEPDLTRLRPLLELGELALIESHDDEALKQVSMLAVVNAPRERVAAVVKAADKYPEFMRNFAEQKTTPLANGTFQLEWELEVPFANLNGKSIMSLEPDGSIEILNTEGDIPRARFRWELIADGPARTVAAQYAYTDIRKASFFTKLLIERQPLFEHGVVIASTTVALQAVKARAEGRR